VNGRFHLLQQVIGNLGHSMSSPGVLATLIEDVLYGFSVGLEIAIDSDITAAYDFHGGILLAPDYSIERSDTFRPGRARSRALI
jgi:hypothetical protein